MVARNDEGYFEKGCLVNIQDERRLRGGFYGNDYIDITVECLSRHEIKQVVKLFKDRNVIAAKVSLLPDTEESCMEAAEVQKLADHLRETAVKYCNMSRAAIFQGKLSRLHKIQEATSNVELCFRSAGLLTLTAEAKKYRVFDTEDVGERMKKCLELLKNEMTLFMNRIRPPAPPKRSGFSMFQQQPGAPGREEDKNLTKLREKLEKLPLPDET